RGREPRARSEGGLRGAAAVAHLGGEGEADPAVHGVLRFHAEGGSAGTTGLGGDPRTGQRCRREEASRVRGGRARVPVGDLLTAPAGSRAIGPHTAPVVTGWSPRGGIGGHRDDRVVPQGRPRRDTLTSTPISPTRQALTCPPRQSAPPPAAPPRTPPAAAPRHCIPRSSASLSPRPSAGSCSVSTPP